LRHGPGAGHRTVWAPVDPRHRLADHADPWTAPVRVAVVGRRDRLPARCALAAVPRFPRAWRYTCTAAGRRFPVTDAALAYILERAAGATTGPPVLAWGDARPGNIIFDPRRVVPAALIDWEGAASAPREVGTDHW